MTIAADSRARPQTARRRSRQDGLLRRLLPRGLFARTLIIVVAPMVLLQGIVAYMFIAQHEANTTDKLTSSIIDQISLVVQLAEGADDAGKRAELTREASDRLGMTVDFLPGAPLPPQPGTTDTDVGQAIATEAQARLKEPYWFNAERFGEMVDLRVQLPDGALRFLVERKRFININMHILPVWMAVSSLILLAVAILFLRNQVRPIQRLAAAAEAFGRGRDVPDFRPAGAREVRRAAIAFIGMKQRLARQMQQRTEMLAGVSHDLRTPLTRMKLELAMMGDEATSDLRNDVLEMERMLDEYLAFARGEGGEQSAPADLAELIAEIADDARRKHGDRIATTAASDLKAEVKRAALKRCLTNLVDNALKYGKRAVVTATADEDAVEIIVDDDGPGIPPDRRAEAFKPFRRLDQGRNLAAGGVGLGLAIARDIARGHGGDIRLVESPLGGLRARVSLPR